MLAVRPPHLVRPLVSVCRSSWGSTALRKTQSWAQPGQPASSMVVESSVIPCVWTQVLERYDAAQAQHASSSIDTNTELLEDGGITFILKIAAKLRDKPKPAALPSEGSEKREWRNPFLPYDEALWVQHLSATHTLLLNKFNVVAHHLLVVTRAFEAQLDPLNAADMEATWAVMQAMPNGGLAFYNCGPESGASQPHKHVQLVPLPLEGADLAAQGPAGVAGAGADPGPPIWPAVKRSLAGVEPWRVTELRSLPFAAFGAPLPGGAADVSPGQLADCFASALAHCREFVAAQRQLEGGSSRGPGGEGPAAAPLSYNMLLTRRFLLLVPRAAEADGPVSCNSVAFAGSFFVRSREEVEHVKSRGPLRILAAVGLPWPQ